MREHCRLMGKGWRSPKAARSPFLETAREKERERSNILGRFWLHLSFILAVMSSSTQTRQNL